MKIRAKLSIGFPTAVREETLEIEDDASEGDINEMVDQWAWEYIDVGWKKGNK